MHTKAVDRSRPVQIASTPASQEKTSPKTQIDTRSKSSITPQSQESSCCSWLINALKSFGRSLLYCLTFQWLFTSKKSSKEGADKSQDASTKSAVKEEKKPVVKKETKAPEDKPQQASSVREIRQPSQTPSSSEKKPTIYAPSSKGPAKSEPVRASLQASEPAQTASLQHVPYDQREGFKASCRQNGHPEHQLPAPAAPPQYDLMQGFEEWQARQKASRQQIAQATPTVVPASSPSPSAPVASVRTQEVDVKDKPINEQIEDFLDEVYKTYEPFKGLTIDKPKLKALLAKSGCKEALWDLYLKDFTNSRFGSSPRGISRTTEAEFFQILDAVPRHIIDVLCGAKYRYIYTGDLDAINRLGKYTDTLDAIEEFFKDPRHESHSSKVIDTLRIEFAELVKKDSAWNIILLHWKYYHPLELSPQTVIMNYMRNQLGESQLIHTFFRRVTSPF